MYIEINYFFLFKKYWLILSPLYFCQEIPETCQKICGPWLINLLNIIVQ